MARVVIVALTVMFLGSMPASAEPGDVQAVAAALRASTCQNCHGIAGDSKAATVPRLNGQSSPYLYDRLHSLRYPIRESPRAIHAMGDIAPNLDSKVIAVLANFYAVQTPMQGHLEDQAGAEGEQIYKRGAGKDIPACQGCHGKEGQGSSRAPRLAGQHGEYIALQLQAFATAARIGDPMNHHVWVMTPEQMQSVASYLGGKRE